MSKFIDSKDSAKATYPLHTRIAAGAMGTLLGITMTSAMLCLGRPL